MLCVLNMKVNDQYNIQCAALVWLPVNWVHFVVLVAKVFNWLAWFGWITSVVTMPSLWRNSIKKTWHSFSHFHCCPWIPATASHTHTPTHTNTHTQHTHTHTHTHTTHTHTTHTGFTTRILLHWPCRMIGSVQTIDANLRKTCTITSILRYPVIH